VQQRQIQGVISATCVLLLVCGQAAAEIDLRNATVEHLDNGMTVILLEDRNFPVVSTQMLYRVGARDESYGQTGIAHFLEHMAFRGSEYFPDTGLVSSIYAVGGEWHGYTWTDQTTYFATVPKEHLDSLLRIEADRMTRLRISPDDMEAERGAVLAEMHMYENYPTSTLLDAVMFASFLGHPYRNNTIGWESDIANLEHEEVVAFYKRHYQPANAVLAVVGDIDGRKVSTRIRDLFEEVQGSEPTPLPRTVEPLQNGERRVRLYGEADVKRFMIGWRAPSVNHADFAAFLVLQDVLGGGSGVNFRQNDWGTPVRDDALLHGIADELTTWYPPSAQNYVFVVGGTIAPEGDESVLEQGLEDRLAEVRRTAPDDDAIAAAVLRVGDELVYDVETTEDAAHQLAFFDGLQALENFLALPERVSRVTPDDVQRVARWLEPERRSIAWHVPDSLAYARADKSPEPWAAPRNAPSDELVSPPAPLDSQPVPLPETRKLRGGIPAIVLQSDVSRSAYLQVVLPDGNLAANGIHKNSPVLGHSSLAYRFRPDELQDIAARARRKCGSGAGHIPFIRSGNGDRAGLRDADARRTATANPRCARADRSQRRRRRRTGLRVAGKKLRRPCVASAIAGGGNARCAGWRRGESSSQSADRTGPAGIHRAGAGTGRPAVAGVPDSLICPEPRLRRPSGPGSHIEAGPCVLHRQPLSL
jgi:zinc protease